jgi:hypothetical protein
MSGKVTAPIARSTAYDFNAHLSSSHTRDRRMNAQQDQLPCNDEEHLDVNEHEFLFEVADVRHVLASRMKCKSSLNGVSLPLHLLTTVQNELQRRFAAVYTYPECNFATRDGRKAWHTALNTRYGGDDDQPHWSAVNIAFNRYIRYVGVAVTPCKGGPSKPQQRQGFSATRGGLNTVAVNLYNKLPIPAGSRVCIQFDVRDILRAEIDGARATKLIPRLCRVDDLEETILDVHNVLIGDNAHAVRHRLRQPAIVLADVKYLVRGLQPYT